MKLGHVLARWWRRPSQTERRLVHHCRGDLAQAERLIAHEVARRPQLSRAQAAHAALDRWTRDR